MWKRDPDNVLDTVIERFRTVCRGRHAWRGCASSAALDERLEFNLETVRRTMAA